jgi:heme A synthase
MRMLFFAHSGLRYLVLIAGFAALAYYIYAVVTKGGDERKSRIFGSAFVGLLDLQIVIGIIMVALGLFYSALIGHLVLMLGAAGVAHGALILARSSPTPERADSIRLAGVVLALLFVVGGIMAIGRPVLGTGSPTMIY